MPTDGNEIPCSTANVLRRLQPGRRAGTRRWESNVSTSATWVRAARDAASPKVPVPSAAITMVATDIAVSPPGLAT
jgi:hypothetical protein